MCGICAVIDFDSSEHPPSKDLVSAIGRRGPDSVNTLSFSSFDASARLEITSSVLSLRGEALVFQPAKTSKDVFCWNGEAWRIDGHDVEGSDTIPVLDRLAIAAAEASLQQQTSCFVQVLSTISGPFAFFYYDQANGLAFFGRDPLGRRSLLYCFSSPFRLIVSSVASKSEGLKWIECQPGTLYLIKFNGIDDAPDFNELETTPLPDRRFATFKYFRKNQLQVSDSLGTKGYASTDSPIVATLKLELERSLRYRVQNIRSATSNGPKLAVLFSGGLDCSLLAALIDQILPVSEDIDLLNVAFQNPRVEAGLKRSNPGINIDIYSHCPDRITAQAAHKELCSLSSRKWNLVEIDISYVEYLAHKPAIVDLMYPHNTEMDLSIASAFYFAARGEGFLDCDREKRIEYSTPARVLISGLGADELFGGYTRHLAAYERGGDAAVLAELELELERLPHRNLGRDDRVISNWGREARYPFLDEQFVSFASSLSVKTRCGFGMVLQPGQTDVVTEPGKRLLRLLAWNLGLRRPACEKKRAIQFGARTAKMEGGKTKGHHEIS